METAKTHKHKFKAEVKQLLDILTHSLYTNREIFLRELISNASDALEKVRFEKIGGGEVVDPDADLEIRLSMDKDANMLVIEDTGVGMNEAEIVKNIGTIAHSGTSDFIKHLAESKGEASNIIGRFGVGFYSVFMVADKVTIRTRTYRSEDKPILWESDGVNNYEVTPLEGEVPRGTKIQIHLKEDAAEFLEKYKLEDVIKKHSNFVSFPIKVEDEQVNKVRAIWREPKFQLKKEDYDEFYKFLTFDTEEPLDTLHISVDAPVQFNSIVFLPKKNMDLFGNRDERGLDLYVRRVLIQHEFKDLLPEYLRFLRGVVDSEDIPLNISRETLQENTVVNKIRNTLVGQVLGHFEKKAKDEAEKYNEFWDEFGKQFKLGYQDWSNQEKFANLLRFNSSAQDDEKERTGFADYVERMKEDQKEIYFHFAPSRESMKKNPHLEIFRKKGIEVLYVYEPIDEIVLDSLRKFKDFDLKSVEQADPENLEKFSDTDTEKEVEKLSKEDEKSLDKLLKRMKEILGERVTDVKISKRLTDSPSCLVSPDGTMSSGMQRIMQIMNKDMSVPTRVMEINEKHTLVRNLINIFKNDKDDAFIVSATEQLYESSLLMEGYLNDPNKMVTRIEEILEQASNWYLKK
jgi:molecular chaperone HtpG